MNKYHVLVTFFSAFLNIEGIFAQSVPITTLFNCTKELELPYGITSHITWRGYDHDYSDQCLKEIESAGYNILRTDFNYTGINWGKDKLDYGIWDEVASGANKKQICLSPIVYLARYNKFTSGYEKEYTRYLSGCLERYGPTTSLWEIWNEMDQMYAKDGKVSAKEYVPLLRSSYKTIKSFGDKNKVLLGAIGDLSKPYFEELLKEGASNYYDVTNIHYYSARNVPEAILPFYVKVNELLTKYAVSKPLWLTETGYSTFPNNSYEDPDLFYKEVLPAVYRQLGVETKKSCMAVLLDKRVNIYIRNQDNPVIGTGFKNIKALGLDDISRLDVKRYPVLMILYGESFPMNYFSGLESYMKKGGTVVFPEGGALLYYDLDINTGEMKSVGKSYYKRLHIDCMFTWDGEAKQRGVKNTMDGIRLNHDIVSNYCWSKKDLESPKYFTDANLKGDDSMIPLIEGYDDVYKAPVAVCYQYDSELKGNLIIQARSNWGSKISENLQAIRYPRLFLLSFAAGVDKVFSYCLTDQNTEEGGYGVLRKDLSRKDAFYAVRTLTAKCPSGSTRPRIETNNHQYIASWKTNKGKQVYAVWTDMLGQESKLKITGDARYYDMYGNSLRKGDFNISPSVIYIENAKSVSFQ